MSLSAMSFDLREPGVVLFTPPPDLADRSWHFAVFRPTDRHVLSVALQAADRAAPSLPAQRFDARWALPADGHPLVPHRLSA
jgi:hypothetical protein